MELNFLFVILFVTYHWWQLEKPKNRLKTLPFLLAQFWPQYRMLKLIYKGYIRKDPRWRYEQTIIQENIMGVEPFIESIPQYYWFTYLWKSTLGCIGPAGKDYVNPLGMVAFITSVLSAGYGLTNFLRVGPLKIIPNRPASGFGHLSFWLVFLTNLSSLIARGLLITVTVTTNDPMVLGNLGLGIFTSLMFLPQLFLAVMSLLITTGFKLQDTLGLVAKFPAVALMPVFTPFTFGPDTFSCRWGGRQGNKMRLHYGFTVLNLFLTAIGFFCCFYLDADWMTSNKDYAIHSDEAWMYIRSIFSVVSCGLFLLAAILTITIILTGKMTCCEEKIKPKRRSRAIDSLLANPRSKNDREASQEDTPENPEAILLGDKCVQDKSR